METLHPADPLCLSSGTIQGIISQLKGIFERYGLGKTWDDGSGIGNPADSLLVKRYLKSVKIEQAAAHVIQNQAKPLFVSKLSKISSFITDTLNSENHL